jgi:HK97 family phage portal protein
MLGRLNNPIEERAISFQAIWGAGDSLAWQSDSGANVTPDSAMGIVPFYSAINLISGTISTLPLDVYERKNGDRKVVRPKPVWVDKPDVDLLTGQAHWQQVLISLLVWGNSYTRIFRDKNGEIVNMIVLDPTLVDVKRNAIGRKIYTYKGDDEKVYTSDDILHITDMIMPGDLKGKGRVEALKENLGLSIALQAFAARFFGGGTQTSGIIEFPGELKREQAKDLAEGFDAAHRGYRRAHKTGVLSGGAKYVQTSTPNDANQFLQSREFATLDVARMYQIPPHMLGVTSGSQARASVEQLAIDFVTHTLRPWAEKVERGYSTLLAPGQFIRFNLDGLVRADFVTRMQGYSIASQAGWMSIDDIRRLEDFSPVAGGDVYRVPLANVNLSAAGLVETEKLSGIAMKMIQVGFDPEEVLKAFGLPAIPHTGVPNVQLQPVASLDPTNPQAVYGANT